MEDCGPGADMSVAEEMPENILLPTLNPEDLKCEDVNEPHILPPDHPLMERFQQSLKEYLLRTKAQLNDEIDELKYNIKQKQINREQHGVALYDMQQEIKKQNKLLEEYTSDVQEINAKRLAEEKSLQKQKCIFQEKLNMSKQQKMNYNERLVDLDNLQAMESNIRKWSQELEEEISSSQRIVSRDAQMQRSMAEDKKKCDIFYYNMDLDVRKREAELAEIQEEIAKQGQVVEALNTSLSDANADLEVLQQEYKRLSGAWSEVIVSIAHRDKIYFEVRQGLEKEKENFKLIGCDIEGTKKQISKEKEQRQKLETFKERLSKDYTNIRIECQKQSQILTLLEKKTNELPVMLEQSEHDFREAKKETIKLDSQLQHLRLQLNKNHNKKKQMEEDILRMAQDNLISDKASEYRLKILGVAQEERRAVELNLARADNELATVLFELEKNKSVSLNLREEGDQLNLALKNAQVEFDECNNNLKTTEYQINEKVKRIEKLTQQLEELIKDAEGSELSPIERKIKDLEMAIQEKGDLIHQAQEFWLIMQGHFVHLSTKRTEQLNELQLTEKQMLLIKQKALKIDEEIRKLDDELRELMREIQNFTHTYDNFGAKLLEKKNKHEVGEQECEIFHSDMLEMLRDNEMKALRTEQNIGQLDEEIRLNKEIAMNLHRETLSWETKYKLIEETLRWRKNEQQRESEIGVMKAEIHRMQVRYSQLQRAQEKLIQDLDHCVKHREQIFLAALTKQKLFSNPKHSKQSQPPSRKIAELEKKLRQVENEISTLNDKQLAAIRKDRQQIQDEITNIKRSLDEEIRKNNLVSNEIEQGVLLKQNNLDIIIRKQNRAKYYRRINCDDVAAKLPRSQANLEMNTQKQKEMNDYLWQLTQTLLTDFPEKTNLLNRIGQILRD